MPPAPSEPRFKTIYVERLTLAWLYQHAIRFFQSSPKNKIKVYYLDYENLALILAHGLACIYPIVFEEFRFQAADIRGKDGVSIRLRVLYEELPLMASLIFRDIPAQLQSDKRLFLYLMKAPLTSYDLYSDGKYYHLRQAIILINFVRWHIDKKGVPLEVPQLYLYQRCFFQQLCEYAQSKGVTLCSMKPYRSWRISWQRTTKIFSKLNGKVMGSLLRHAWWRFFNPKDSRQDNVFASEAKFLVESRLDFNLNNPQLVSDLFFLNAQDGVQGKDVLLVFNGTFNPVSEDKFKAMHQAGIKAVALSPQSSFVSPAQVPVFSCDKSKIAPQKRRHDSDFPGDYAQFIAAYERARSYWEGFFKRYNIKLWTSFYKNEPEHIAMADALSAVEGVSAIYQRSYEPNSSILVASGGDIIFSFSNIEYDFEMQKGSEFRYHVAAGYLGDCRFEHLKPGAKQLRQRLTSAGARHIVAYFDEATIDDGRWFFGHRFVQDNYAFWLEKLLQEPDLGLIFKPKAPNTLRHRLGAVEKLLSRAQQTGRCYLFEEGTPAAASLASDIAVHESIFAGTAGLESALAGSRTILMDLEGWPLSPLYELGDDVVFKDWNSAWQACSEYFKNPLRRPKLGDWSAMIDQLDPFHDGLAAYRMSGYLKELLEGLRRSEAPVEVMDRVAENYARRWGKDKIHRFPRK